MAVKMERERETDLVGLEVPFAPLYENQLSNDERADENEHHLGMHRLMPAVLLMHTSVFHSGTDTHTLSFSAVYHNEFQTTGAPTLSRITSPILLVGLFVWGLMVLSAQIGYFAP